MGEAREERRGGPVHDAAADSEGGKRQREQQGESEEEEVSCADSDLMTARDFLAAHRNDSDLTRLASDGVAFSRQVPASSSSLAAAIESSESTSVAESDGGAGDSAGDEDDEDDERTANDDLIDDAASLDDFYEDMITHPGIAPVIRFVSSAAELSKTLASSAFIRF